MAFSQIVLIFRVLDSSSQQITELSGCSFTLDGLWKDELTSSPPSPKEGEVALDVHEHGQVNSSKVLNKKLESKHSVRFTL